MEHSKKKNNIDYSTNFTSKLLIMDDKFCTVIIEGLVNTNLELKVQNFTPQPINVCFG
jgi:hypothetical protein